MKENSLQTFFKYIKTVDDFIKEWNSSSDKLLVHTSGSTGNPKPIMVGKKEMRNSAETTCDYLGLRTGDTALLCMSTDYIAGKMMLVRAMTRGLKLISIPPSGHPFNFRENHRCIMYDFSKRAWSKTSCSFPTSNISFAAMVPMQVYNTLQYKEEKEHLMRVRHLIIGGGAIDEALEDELRTFPNAIWSTYGMTETLSHIALRRINGLQCSLWYEPFSNINISLNEDRCLVIDAPSICDKRITTNDIAEIAQDGRHFKILGRKDNTICSGGIKIQAEEVERTLKPYIHVPYAISKCHDPKFGEIVVLITQSNNTEDFRETCKRVLPKYQCPRLYIHTDKLPMTETGKPAREEIRRLINKT